MNIYGKKVVLRAMEPADMECFREILNDPDVSKMVVGWSFPVSACEQEDWYEKAVRSADKRFTIALTEDGSPVGMAALTDIDWVNRSAFHGIKLHPSCPRRQGLGTDAVFALMRYAFDELNLNRLDTAWLLYNQPSKHLYEKLGWHEEGIKKQAVYRNGRYHDIAVAGVLREDYLKLIENDDT